MGLNPEAIATACGVFGLSTGYSLGGPPLARLQLQLKDGGDLLLDAGQQKYILGRKGRDRD